MKWVEMGWIQLRFARLRISQAILLLNDVEFDLKPLNPNQFPDQKKTLEIFNIRGHPYTKCHFSRCCLLKFLETSAFWNPRKSQRFVLQAVTRGAVEFD